MHRRRFLQLSAAGFGLLLPPRRSRTPDDAVLAYIRSTIGETLRPPATADPAGKSIPLPVAYNVPCVSTHFQNLFYFDTYFLNRGLIALGLAGQARNNVDAFIFLVEQLGFVPNSNRLDMTNRSQPPYLAMMVDDVFSITADRRWLQRAYDALNREYHFWTVRRGTSTGLSRYHHHATDEYLLDFYEHLRRVRLPLPEASDAEKLYVSSHRLAEAESGYDFTPRFEGRCADFLPVDLNSNLYRYERLMSRFARILANGQADLWAWRAEQRRSRINHLLWNEQAGLYMDYDFVHNRFSEVPSAAAFQPLWAGCATRSRAARSRSALPLFEYDHGITPCAPGPRDAAYQWDHPNTWPPLAYLTAEALETCGYVHDARRIRAKYVRLVHSVFEQTGTLWEKYNAVTGTTDVREEYKTPPMMGWTAGIYAWMRLTRQTPLP